MTDINRLIEEEAREYATKKLIYPPLLVANARMKIAVSNVTFNAYKSGYESALHSSSWRKVSEELPKIKEENYFINVKRKDNPIRVETLCIFAVWVSVKEYLDFYEVVEWKPID